MKDWKLWGREFTKFNNINIKRTGFPIKFSFGLQTKAPILGIHTFFLFENQKDYQFRKYALTEIEKFLQSLRAEDGLAVEAAENRAPAG